MRKLSITIILCILSACMWGQGDLPTLPQLMTPSPKATMMNRFGEYPVNLYTGLIDITVPVYTIEAAGVSVPIEFRYHASGLKYDDLPMELGLGWTLSAGGILSYASRGTSELYPPVNGSNWGWFIKDMYEIDTRAIGDESSDHAYMGYVANKNVYDPNQSWVKYADGEYDEYSYSFLHHTGKFYRPDIGSPIFVPAKAMKVNFYTYQPELVDENGVTYYFQPMESDNYNRNRTYYLTKILSADKCDSISFQYTRHEGNATYAVSRPLLDQSFTVVEAQPINGYKGQELQRLEILENYSTNSKSFYPPLLNSVTFKGGKVEFTYNLRSLQKVTIRNDREVIRTVSLEKSSDHSWLNAVSFTDSNENEVYKYGFEYDGTIDKSWGIDYWGYYNGNRQSVYIPDFRVPVPSYQGGYRIPGMDRTPNATYMQKGILKTITYPTKGYTTFQYEPHKASNEIYGGLRIKEIQSFDADGTLAEKKWYKYGNNESGNGRAAITISQEDFCTYSRELGECWEEGRVLSPAYYKQLRRYGVHPKRSYFTSGSSVVYPKITEYTGDGMNVTGKTVYEYSDQADIPTTTIQGRMAERPIYSYSWMNGHLTGKRMYDKNNQLVSSLENGYKIINASEYLNLSVSPYFTFNMQDGDLIKENYNRFEYEQYSYYVDASIYDFYNYYITTGLYVSDYSVEVKDGVSVRTEYEDYSLHGFPAKVNRTTSDGNTNVVTRFKYPYDFRTQDIYARMVSGNRLSPVVEQTTYKKTGNAETFLSGMKTNYSNGWQNAY